MHKLLKEKDALFNINKNYCYFFLRKNGKIIYNPTKKYNTFICLINNILNYELTIFPLLNGKTEDNIIEKLLILYVSQKNDLHYIDFNKKKSIIIFFKPNNINKFLKYFYIVKKIDKILEKILITDINILTLIYTQIKLKYTKLNNNKIFIELFYNYYIYIIEDDLYKKHNKKFIDFSNYHEFYLFLKKHKYIDNYYKKTVPLILKNYVKIKKYIFDVNEIELFNLKYIKKIKKMSNINLFDLIDKNVDSKFNKDYIKNKFSELIKKYNI